MRILILPLVIVLLCSSTYSFSQTGASCATAYTITPIDGSCSNYQMSTVTGNQSTGTSCGAAYTNGRRITWFKFTPATNIMAASFLISLDTVTQMQATIYDPGATGCGLNVNAPLATLCAAGGVGTLMAPATTVLLSTRTYYIRVYSNVPATSPFTTHFINICATPVTLNTIPTDESCNNYPVGDLGTGANYSPLPAGVSRRCGYANDRRVTWVKFTPTSNIPCATFSIAPDVDVDMEVALFTTGGLQTNSTICMPKTQVGIGGVGGTWAPELPFTFNSGTTYYLRIYTDINDNAAHFINICEKAVVPPNDLCSGATRFDNNGIDDNNVCATGSAAQGGTEPAWITSNSVNLLCAPVLQNTAWYYFVVSDNTKSTIVTVSSVNCDNYGGGSISGSNAGIQLGLLTGPSNMATCVTTPGSLAPPPNTPTHCYATPNSSFGFTVPPNAAIPSGTKMYIAVDGYSGANCSYKLSTANAIPIPVKIKYFNVWKQAQSNEVRWLTSWETNNKNFEIERSLDGREFKVIGSVPGVGNSSEDVQYKFEDYEMPAIAYYRLKQIDIDGRYEYSNVVVIKRDNIKTLFSLTFANPVHNNAIVVINTEKVGTTVLRVVDVAGREISTQIIDCNRGNNIVAKDFSRLPSGTYYLVAIQGENRIVKPFIKQ